MIKLSGWLILSVLIFICSYAQGEVTGIMEIESVLNKLRWLGHDSFLIESQDKIVIYIDPWKLKDISKKADIILITHEHFDHLSVEDVKNLSKKDTVIVCASICAPQLKGIKGDVRLVNPGDRIDVKGIPVEAVFAYNTNKPFHPKKEFRVGFIIAVDGVKIYHAGDTDLIPEMSNVVADIALLPVSGTYVMTAKEAAEAAGRIRGIKIAIPMHYGDIVGSTKDAETFGDLLNGKVDVRILSQP